MHVLDVLSIRHGCCRQRRTQQTRSFTTSQNIIGLYLYLPTNHPARASAHQTKHGYCCCTSLPQWSDPGHVVASSFKISKSLRPALRLTVLCIWLLRAVLHDWTQLGWQQCCREELTSLTPACCFTHLGLPGHASASIKVQSYFSSQRCSDRRLHSRLYVPDSHGSLRLHAWFSSPALLHVCVLVWKSKNGTYNWADTNHDLLTLNFKFHKITFCIIKLYLYHILFLMPVAWGNTAVLEFLRRQ